MLTAIIKLVDIAARSLFVLIVMYKLPMRSTGQFGLSFTLITFYAFFCGFERYIDVQRKIVNQSKIGGDLLLVRVFGFYIRNYLIFTPIMLLLLKFWVKLELWESILCVTIAIGEHISNEVYRIVLVLPSYMRLLVVMLVKNCVLLVCILSIILIEPGFLNFQLVLKIWVLASFFGGSIVCVIYFHKAALSLNGILKGINFNLREQLSSSKTHFFIGLVAMAALQADRFVVGGILSLEESGVYYRHILLASFAYQIFTVISYNRIAPQIYTLFATGKLQKAIKIITREIYVIVPSAILLICMTRIVNHSWIQAVNSFNILIWYYLALLLFGFLLRALADYNALILNAIYMERSIFLSQLSSVMLGVIVNILLTHRYGLAGAVYSAILGSTFYLLISSYSIWRHREAIFSSR